MLIGPVSQGAIVKSDPIKTLLTFVTFTLPTKLTLLDIKDRIESFPDEPSDDDWKEVGG